ncbi:XcbC [Bibersteinia trehalosi USDA-ARS-USMARC-188]|uniref:XcbC n=3 Tax=Bibersteinia trehalosi TaxID=47735 RepID=A0A4V7I7I0_BIBTR|nr:phosphodiester glycosidase family protein [Bibersteinia trehalosi]AGH39277.1 XcbC [Bibersteinia trehalosi USDA-ARS-USMARC-192]AHG80977.1 XcbC [Bibersteinia trehalosi USDA-ARS-USMARC-188]AHG83189.1 XcbC [Bibersteinia trehalosi USDA-ARS-USMARC-189]OAQ14200.1 membrane protein [Bibersteinia trehalosi Y31]
MKSFFPLFFLLTSGSVYAKNCIEYLNKSPFHIARVDLNCKNIELLGSEKSDNGKTVSEFANKYQTNVAINANFYWKDYTPIGLVVSNGKRWSKYGDTRSRVVFACDKANNCFIEDKNKATPLNKKWQLAIAGWHFYNAKTGKFECAPADKVGCKQDIYDGKHPRTMLGLDEEKNLLYLVVVEGRQLTFRGVSLDELATLAKNLGLSRAINLDGGGSSGMVVENKRVNSLPILQGSERQVANHFGVKLK